jgi:hypothetical protein
MLGRAGPQSKFDRPNRIIVHDIQLLLYRSIVQVRVYEFA